MAYWKRDKNGNWMPDDCSSINVYNVHNIHRESSFWKDNPGVTLSIIAGVFCLICFTLLASK